jgi:small GTP-binding protein
MKYVGIDSLLEQTIDETLPNYMKVVTIGAHRAGKTALILTLNNKWTHAFESFYTVYIDQEYLEQEGKQLVLWDTAGEKDYERLRPLCYPITTVFLLCFSICVSRNVAPDESGIAQAVATFIPEARKYCPDVPIILIGTKSDLRNSNVDESTEHVIPSSFGEFLARETGCLAYMEVSAKGKVGIEKVRRAIVRAQKFAPSQKSGKKKCHLQ